MAIQIIGNVGNQGYALPMVSASPVDVNQQYVLGWDPVQQALNYVPFVVAAIGDITVVRDLAVGRNLAVAGAAVVTGAFAPNGGIAPTDSSLEITAATVAMSGSMTAVSAVTGGTVSAAGSGNTALLAPTSISFNATQVVNARKTGWVALTGTPLKTTFATGTITLPQLAGIVMALQADLISHGLIGA